MALFPTNAAQVQAFAGALYGVQVGSTTMTQVTSDITVAGGLTNALNAYYTVSFGNVATATVAASLVANIGISAANSAAAVSYVTGVLNATAANARGAAVMNILNTLANLAADATFGADATAWNTKVTAAVAYTGSTNVAIGSTVSTGSAFTLTTGADTFTGSSNADTDTLGPLLALDPQVKPDLLLIVVEGLGRSFSGPGARLGSFTPFLDELAARSLYWDNFLATQGRTFAVLPSVLASLPFGADNAQLPPHDNLPRLLGDQGYSLRYFSGSNLTFDQQGEYLRQSGVQALWSEKDFSHPERRLSEWGYADGDLLQAVSQAPAPASPSFTLVQTMSMHTPFVVPDQEVYRRKVDERLDQLGVAAARRAPYQRQRDIYASVLYTDEALRSFFQQLEKSPRWRNTIVMITGDHRLPEIPMDTRLERYHVPLIVASPLLRQPRRMRALSSHFDLAPALLAMLSSRYGMQTPARTHWMGTGLDTALEWRNLHSLPLKQTKTDLDDYVSGRHYLGQGKLYTLSDGLQPEPAEDPVERERLRKALATVQAHLATVDRTHPLLPAQSAGERTGYVAAARTLEPQDRAARLQGVVVSGAQGQLQANGQLQASGVFTQHGAESAPMFVPLLVLTDAKGQQIAEGYGKAMQMQAGQTTTVSLNLQAPDVPPGPLYLAMVVSHPDTGKPIGQGQYRVQVQR